MLRIANRGKQESGWTKDQVIAGLLKFKEIHGRFPKSRECDSFEFLPSGRSIERNFGGILALRKDLGINEEYHRGDYRRDLAHKINDRGREIEMDLEKFLIAKFGEVAVHREKPVGEGRERLDFIVYFRGGLFGIDIFFADNLHSLRSVVNIKQNKYVSFSPLVYFVCANGELSQEQLDRATQEKDKPLRSNIKLVTLKTLQETLEGHKALSIS